MTTIHRRARHLLGRKRCAWCYIEQTIHRFYRGPGSHDRQDVCMACWDEAHCAPSPSVIYPVQTHGARRGRTKYISQWTKEEFDAVMRQLDDRVLTGKHD